MRKNSLSFLLLGIFGGVAVAMFIGYMWGSRANAQMVADDGVFNPIADEGVAVIQPCCTIEPNDPPIVEPPIIEPAPVRHGSSGSYIIKPVVKPLAVWDVVKFGDISENVKTFQRVLNNQIKAGLIIDGVYGQLTQKAWEIYAKTLNK